MITSKLIQGILPSLHILHKYSLIDEFAPLIQPFKVGDLKTYMDHISRHAVFFQKKKILSILKYRCRLIIYRNLIKRVWLLTGEGVEVSFMDLWVAFRVCRGDGGIEGEWGIDEVENCVVGLIDEVCH